MTDNHFQPGPQEGRKIGNAQHNLFCMPAKNPNGYTDLIFMLFWSAERTSNFMK